MTLQQQVSLLPPGQRKVVAALLEDPSARTYPDVAALLGIHIGSVHTHLRRFRLRHPELYAVVMAERSRQLATRHKEAERRAKEHSRQWHRKQANRRYYYRFGEWPWERRNRC